MYRKFLAGVALNAIAGLAFAQSVEIELQDTYACPLFVSTTIVSDTAGVPFEFLFEWNIISAAGGIGEAEGPDCCTYLYQKAVVAPTDSPSAVWTTHYLNPAQYGSPGMSPQGMKDDIAGQCPEYMSTGEIYTSPCDTKYTQGNCTESEQREASHSSGSIAIVARPDDEPVRMETFFRPEVIAKSQDPSRPLLVANDIFPTRQALLDRLKSLEANQGSYDRVTDIAEVLRERGCVEAGNWSGVQNSGSRFATFAFDCSTGFVVAHESYRTNISRPSRPAGGARGFEVRPGVNGVSEYLRKIDGAHKSTTTWWEGAATLTISLYSNEAGQQAWLRDVAATSKVARQP
jgi:hypothetical protein